MQKLKSRALNNLKKGRHSDGGGLYLNVKSSGARSWVFIWKRQGRTREIGLGGFKSVTLAMARDRADLARKDVANGIGPKERYRPTVETTFLDAAKSTIDKTGIRAKSEKTVYQWERSLFEFCKPIHALDVKSIGIDEVLQVLRPVWDRTPETGRRTRARIEKVLDHARVMGWRERGSDNPARLKGVLEHVLTKHKDKVQHFPALPYSEIPDFMAKLQDRPALSARLMEFAILTAARPSEAREAVWPEIDLDAGLWTIPDVRMKKGREHIVPLNGRAVEILRDLHAVRLGENVFPGNVPGKPLSDGAMSALLKRMGHGDVTAHGTARSSFRDWAGDETNHDSETIEFALSHVVGDAAAKAYRRSTALNKRRRLMDAWGRFATGLGGGKVIRLAGG